MRKRLAKVLVILIFIVSVILYFRNVLELIRNSSIGSISTDIKGVMDSGENITVVVDAGHGGKDPGKVGINGSLEKDINLQIAKKLKTILNDKGFCVIMTRTEDVGLYSDNDKNKKMADLKERVRIINESDAVVAISIHQNSFPTQNVKGAQAFYYSKSEQSKKLATFVQKMMNTYVDVSNTRVEKPNDVYYLLKKTQKPIAIVECGFLSNYDEAQMLETEDYQQRMAEGICNAVINWFNSYVE